MNMNDNHAHNTTDQQLIEKVDRLLRDGQPSGDALLDDLATSTPKAKARLKSAK